MKKPRKTKKPEILWGTVVIQNKTTDITAPEKFSAQFFFRAYITHENKVDISPGAFNGLETVEEVRQFAAWLERAASWIESQGKK